MKGEAGSLERAEEMRATQEQVAVLFAREHEPMHRLAFTMLGNDADADEVVQDAFFAVATRWQELDNPGGYLRVCVVNGARKRMRSQQRRDSALTRIGSDAGGGTDAPPDYLLDVLDGLPERQRTAVVLTYYAGLDSGEIGQLMDCPAATVRSLVHRGLAQLREVVER